MGDVPGRALHVGSSGNSAAGQCRRLHPSLIIIILQAYLRHTLKTGAPRFRLKVGNAGCMWRLIGWPPKKPIKKHNCRLQRACTRCLIDSDVDYRTPATAVRDHQQAGREAGYPGRPVRLNRMIGEPDWRTEAGSLKHQLAAIHVDACAKSLQDRGSTPLASTFPSSPSEFKYWASDQGADLARSSLAVWV